MSRRGLDARRVSAPAAGYLASGVTVVAARRGRSRPPLRRGPGRALGARAALGLALGNRPGRPDQGQPDAHARRGRVRPGQSRRSCAPRPVRRRLLDRRPEPGHRRGTRAVPRARSGRLSLPRPRPRGVALGHFRVGPDPSAGQSGHRRAAHDRPGRGRRGAGAVDPVAGRRRGPGGLDRGGAAGPGRAARRPWRRRSPTPRGLAATAARRSPGPRSIATAAASEARGQAREIADAAAGRFDRLVQPARGEADRFTRVLAEARKDPGPFRRRLFLETWPSSCPGSAARSSSPPVRTSTSASSATRPAPRTEGGRAE